MKKIEISVKVDVYKIHSQKKTPLLVNTYLDDKVVCSKEYKRLHTLFKKSQIILKGYEYRNLVFCIKSPVKTGESIIVENELTQAFDDYDDNLNKVIGTTADIHNIPKINNNIFNDYIENEDIQVKSKFYIIKGDNNNNIYPLKNTKGEIDYSIIKTMYTKKEVEYLLYKFSSEVCENKHKTKSTLKFIIDNLN